LVVDCPGGTDELSCDRRCAPHNMFECKQEFICISKAKVCNGKLDCKDGSDETPDACRLGELLYKCVQCFISRGERLFGLSDI
jgi:hypothetical protein